VCKIESLEIDDNIKFDIVQSVNNVSLEITKSCDTTKSHIKKVNPSTNSTEEAYERICKLKNSNIDAARMLFDMHHNLWNYIKHYHHTRSEQ